MPASPAITSPPPQTSGAESSTAPTTTDAAAIGGGIGGALVFVSLFAIGLWFFCRRRRNVRRLRIDLEGEYVAAVTEEMSDAFPARKITPFALSDTEPTSTTNLLKSRGKKLSDLDERAQSKETPATSSGLPSSSSGPPSSLDTSQTVPSSSTGRYVQATSGWWVFANSPGAFRVQEVAASLHVLGLEWALKRPRFSSSSPIIASRTFKIPARSRPTGVALLTPLALVCFQLSCFSPVVVLPLL